MLNEVGPDLWTESHDAIVDEFSSGEERLLDAYMDTINGFSIEYKVFTVYLRIANLMYLNRKLHQSTDGKISCCLFRFRHSR